MKELILMVAIQQFGDYGYTVSSTNTIATLAQVSKGSVFSHYGSKEKLYEAAVTKIYNELCAYVEYYMDETDYSLENFVTLRQQFFNYYKNYENLFYRTLWDIQAPQTPAIQETLDQFNALNRKYVHKYLQHNRLKENVTEDDAIAIISAIQMAAIRMTLGELQQQQNFDAYLENTLRLMNIALKGILEEGSW